MNRGSQKKQMMKCGGKAKRMMKGGKAKKMAHGGKVCRGMGAATQGGKFRKDG